MFNFFKRKEKTNQKIEQPLKIPQFFNYAVEEEPEKKSWNTLIKHTSLESLYDNFISIEQLRSVYKTEKNVPKVLNRIATQFLGVKFYLQNEEEDTIYKHPILTKLNRLSENATLHYECVVDMLLTGNAFLLYFDDTGLWERIKPENISEKKDGVYTISDNSSVLKVIEKDVIHFKMPSVMENTFFGDSPLAVAILNLLLDRYGYEYINTFFQKGGASTGIIETDESNQDKLQRLIMSLRGAFSSRRNAHSDKILPKGCKWVGFGNNFQNMQLRDLLRDNLRDFAAQFGVPPVLLGDTDGVNFANSETQMALFFEQTIQPLQKMYCQSITNNSRFKDFFKDKTLHIDNSGIKYLSDFDKKVEQIASLKQVLTINEIRNFLGYDKTDEEYFKPAQNPFSLFREEPKEDEKHLKSVKKKSFDDPEKLFYSKMVDSIYIAELKKWVDMYIENPQQSMKDLHEKINKTRRDYFVASFVALMEDKLIRFYRDLLKSAASSKHLPTAQIKAYSDDVDIAIEERGRLFLLGKIKKHGEDSFYGYSRTMTERLYKRVQEMRKEKEDLTFNEIASRLRLGDKDNKPFFEEYKSQLNTIARTEIGSAISLTTHKAGDDISLYAKKATKTWSTKLDNFTREPHTNLNGETVYWEKQTSNYSSISDVPFSNGLRYPRDGDSGTPADVINCRCTVLYDILEFE